MKQVLIRQGRVVVEDMPAPTCGEGEVLVRTAFSCISSGTETASLEASEAAPSPGWSRRIEHAGEVLRLASERGLADARAAVLARLEGPSRVCGYSLSGTVLQVGARVRDLVPGQGVACAGSDSAHHAEIVAVPRHLVAAIPAGLSLAHAASVTLGAIALQGVRQADARLGETACVLGLGLVGQLTAALLEASGCRVAAADLDAHRVERAAELGLEHVCSAEGQELERIVGHWTAGRGVDVVLLTAATPSSDPARRAGRLVRRKGRIVVVGAVGLELERGPLYEREAELRMSCSYGPGRYDPDYESEGHDYPFAHVRWTENRNMEEFLRLAAKGQVPLDRLLDRTFPISAAPEAYLSLSEEGPRRPLGVLLAYPVAEDATLPAPARRIGVVPSSRSGALGVALVGPGSFASSTHLPNIAALGPVARLRTVVARRANSAREAARRFAAAHATTEIEEALADEAIDLVVVSTRHDLHAELARRCLEAHKAVYLEKPAATDEDGLERLAAAVATSGRPITVGFNRRFAPVVRTLCSLLSRRTGPIELLYRVNAGRLPRDHWVLGPEGGGRLVGEACHMVDLLAHLVGSRRTGYSLELAGGADLPRGDNFVLTLRYDDGSLATLVYGSLGSTGLGKERIECHWDGASAVIDDFRALELHGIPRPRGPEPAAGKGHRELLAAFVEHVAGRAAEPIPWSEIHDVSRFLLALEREARGEPGRET